MKKKNKKASGKTSSQCRRVNLKVLKTFTFFNKKASAFPAQPSVFCVSLTGQGSSFLAQGWEWSGVLGRQILASVFPIIDGAALGNQGKVGRSVWVIGLGYRQRRESLQLSLGWPPSLVFISIWFPETGSKHVAQAGL